MKKLNINEKKAEKVIPAINSLIDEVEKIKKDIHLIKGVMYDHYKLTGYLEDNNLIVEDGKLKINEKSS